MYGQERKVSIRLDPEVTSFFFDTFKAIYKTLQRGLELLFESVLPAIENIHCLLELQDNEAAFSLCTVNFHDREHGIILAFGTAKGLWFWPKRSLIAGFIHIYKFLDDGKSLELLHKTRVEGAPLASCRFQGRLLGSVPRLYDLGKKKIQLAER